MTEQNILTVQTRAAFRAWLALHAADAPECWVAVRRGRPEDPDALRRELDVIVHGRYELLEPEHPALFVYTRTLGEEKLLVVCSFSEEPQAWDIPAAFREAERLIGNYPESAPEGAVRPWEAFVLRRREAGKAAPEAEA